MKTTTLFLAFCLATCAFAQESATPPKNAAAPPPAAAPEGAGSGGIFLGKDWAGQVTQGSGGQSLKIADLKALLSAYGTPEADTGPHPEVAVYEGPTMNGPTGPICRIAYLTPLDEALKILLKNPGSSSGGPAVAPGFPSPLELHTYDVRAGIFNRLIILTDKSPKRQVVSLVLKAESRNWHPASPPFVKIARDWHTFDYVNTVNSSKEIDTRVNDLRKKGHYLVVNTCYGFALPNIADRVDKGAATTTWYVPEPMIRMILYCIEQRGGK